MAQPPEEPGFVQFHYEPGDGLRWFYANFVQQVNQIMNSGRILTQFFSVEPFKSLFDGEVAHEHRIEISLALRQADYDMDTADHMFGSQPAIRKKSASSKKTSLRESSRRFSPKERRP
jgi:hypothetical protein